LKEKKRTTIGKEFGIGSEPTGGPRRGRVLAHKEGKQQKGKEGGVPSFWKTENPTGGSFVLWEQKNECLSNESEKGLNSGARKRKGVTRRLSGGTTKKIFSLGESYGDFDREF